MRTLLAFGMFHSAINERQCDVIQQRHARQQIETLKHEADGAIAQQGQLVFAQFGDAASIQNIATGTGRIKTTEDIHEGGFSRTGRTHNCNEFAACNAEVHLFERGK